MSPRRLLATFITAACFYGAPGIAAAAEFQVPRLSGPIVDEGGFLSASTERTLTAALQQIKRRGGGTEIAVLTVPDLGGLTIEQASIQVVDEWKLGTADQDNGVLLMFAKKERRVRIEVGQGLEGRLTDAHAKRIIDEAIVPLFRAGETDQGILVGVYQVAKRTNPELDLEAIFGEGADTWGTERTDRGGGHVLGPLIPIIVILVLIVFFGGRGRGGGLLTGLFLGSMIGGRGYGGSHGGGFGGGFSGGFGGGGGFSGGGASGGW